MPCTAYKYISTYLLIKSKTELMYMYNVLCGVSPELNMRAYKNTYK